MRLVELKINTTKHVLADPKNGVETPLYFDRQVVRASDLTLDRASHDAALDRMRRLMHGNGIVSGLIVTGAGDEWVVSSGYGIAPSGAEVFLPEPVVIKDLAAQVLATCGPPPLDCDALKESDNAAIRARYKLESEATAAFLIARAAGDPADLRPAVPEGCGHQGNTLVPSRTCHKVQLELCCSLPLSMLEPDPVCEMYNPYVCRNPKTRQIASYPYVPPPGSTHDYVVLGRFRWVGEQTLQYQPTHRRRLLPTQVIQKWLEACICGLTLAPAAEPRPEKPIAEERPESEERPETGDEVVIEVRPDEPGLIHEDPFGRDFGIGRDAVESGNIDTRVIHREGERIRHFATLGITGADDFLIRDADELAGLTGMRTGDVLEMKKEIAEHGGTDLISSGAAMGNDWRAFGDGLDAAGVATAWTAPGETEVPPSSTASPPIVTEIATPEALEEAGFDSPGSLATSSDAEVAAKLNITPGEAAVVRSDLMRFVPVLGGAAGPIDLP